MVKSLASEQARRRRHRSPEAEAASALYEYERRRFGRRGQGVISVNFAMCQLKRFNYRSVISGSKKGLRLRRFWPDVQWQLKGPSDDSINEEDRYLREFEELKIRLVEDKKRQDTGATTKTATTTTTTSAISLDNAARNAAINELADVAKRKEQIKS